MRKHLLAKQLMLLGMFPKTDLSQPKSNPLQEIQLSQELKQFFAIDPYECRAKAAKGEQLSLYEIGRVFYQFAQRRGYKDMRSSGEAKEDGAIYTGNPKAGDKQGILATEEGIARTKGNTLGAFLASLDTKEERIRNRYTLRSMFMQEFEVIWNSQQPFYPSLLTEETKAIIGDENSGILFFQRELRSQKGLVGKCTLEPKKGKCPASSIYFERFRMFQFINNIEYGHEQRQLNPQERQIVIDICLAKDKSFKCYPKSCNPNIS